MLTLVVMSAGSGCRVDLLLGLPEECRFATSVNSMLLAAVGGGLGVGVGVRVGVLLWRSLLAAEMLQLGST